MNTNSLKLTVRNACFLMIALSVARGSSFLFSKQLLVTIEPLNLLGVRFFLGFLILFLIFFRKIIAVVRKNPRILLAALVLGGIYFGSLATELIGLQYTSASTCSFIENTAIVLIPIIEAILLRRFPQKIIIFSACLSLIGVGLIVLYGKGPAGIGLGELLSFAAAIFFGAAVIVTDRFSKKYDTMALGILYVGVMGAAGLAVSFITESPRLPQTGTEWIMLLFLVGVCTILGFIMQPAAQAPLSSEVSGIITAVNPLTTAVLGWTIGSEYPGVSGVIGAAMILIGIILPNLKKKPA